MESNQPNKPLTLSKKDILHIHVISTYLISNKITEIPPGFVEALSIQIKQNLLTKNPDIRSRQRHPSLPDILTIQNLLLLPSIL